MNRNAFRFVRGIGAALLCAGLSLPVQAGELKPRYPAGALRSEARDTILPFVDHRDRTTSMAWFHLACLSARLRMYPLAMKLFLKSAKSQNALTRVSAPEEESGTGESLMLTANEDSLIGTPEKAEIGSKMVRLSELLSAFSDTADAERYALILLVKQPVFNKRKVFTGIGNVGHTFVSLIRFNRDNSYTSRTFGFYPRKRYPLAASPLFPNVSGMFRDDHNHDWDEMAGRFITKAQFRAIIRSMASYAGRRYHLSKNNCTDFGLRMAAIGGIRVTETASHWPLGSGNNPAWTGQSMLTGKVCSADSASGEELFVAMHYPDQLAAAKP